MKKFERAVLKPKTPKEIQAMTRDLYQMSLRNNSGVTFRQIQQIVNEEITRKKEIWKNDVYQVESKDTKFEGQPMKWLSIKRIDKEPIHDWRDLQKIKNELVGEKCEGFELYPSEDRIVDTANQYHLWVFTDPKVFLPIGFHARMVDDKSISGQTKQRKFK